jgi:hypothetical protein
MYMYTLDAILMGLGMIHGTKAKNGDVAPRQILDG